MAVVLHDPYCAPYAYPSFINPFAVLPKYRSPFQLPVERPALRPQADRLDRLVALAVEKINSAVRELNALAGECDALKSQLAGADSVGERAELKAQLSAANKEIHRLRLLAIADAGADLGSEFSGMQSVPYATNTFAQQEQELQNDYDEGGQEFVESFDYVHEGVETHDFEAHQLEQHSTQDAVARSFHSSQRGKQYSFFGLMVADGIKFREEYGGKHEYGAVKVVKVWGPSAVAGILPMDFITQINRQHVASLQDFNHVVAAIEPNQTVEVVVERQNRQLIFSVHTSNTDIAPGTITHQNIVHAHLIPEDTEEDKKYVEITAVRSGKK